MKEEDLHQLASRYLSGSADAEEIATLEAELGQDPGSRSAFLRHLHLDAALSGHRRPESSAGLTPSGPRKVQWPALSAAAAGLVAVLFTATLVWGQMSSPPLAAATPVHGLLDGSFESGRLGSGFPGTDGAWSGDPAQVVRLDEADRRNVLRFVRPAPDPNTPDGRAISCDVFQLVDLRPLRRQTPPGHEAMLELAADMGDARPPGSPSITLICQLFLFSGNPAEMPRRWPAATSEALATGARLTDSTGGTGPPWQTIRTRCVLPDEADFAVIQIGARRNAPMEDFGAVHADNITLTLRTQPVLPLRHQP